MTTIQVEIDEAKLRSLVIAFLEDHLNTTVKDTDVKIMVRSKQNYRSEWEEAAFKATIGIHIQ